MLIITKSDVNKILKMDELIQVIENSLIDFSLGECIQPAKKGIDFGEEYGLMEVLIGFLTKRKLLGVKALNSRKYNQKKNLPFIYAHIILFDYETGEPLALIEGGSVTASRTAAASAVAAKYLSRKESQNLSIIGTGKQGRTHLESLMSVRQLKKVVIFDINTESAVAFRKEYEKKFNIDIEIAKTVEDAVKFSDIIQLCTTTMLPILKGKWVRPGTHINSIASYSPKVREVDTELVLKAKVVTDSRIDALSGAGELVIPIAEGQITGDHLYAEIGEIAHGLKPGRENNDEITFYKSMGIAVQDVTSADYLYRRALENKLGSTVNLDD